MIQLTLFQGKKKKEVEVPDDEDDDAVRSCVSQESDNGTVC
jgi:hypothetical protein